MFDSSQGFFLNVHRSCILLSTALCVFTEEHQCEPSAFIPTPGHLQNFPDMHCPAFLLFAWRTNSVAQMTLWTMGDNIALNNCGLGREWQTEEIQSLLPDLWWWAHALSCIPLAACHQVISWMAVTSHFLESNQLIVFPFCYGHKACNNEKLGSSCTTVLSLIWTTLQPPMKKAPSCLLLYIGAVNTWRYVLYEWGAMEAVTCILLLLAVSCQFSITHFGIWYHLPTSESWK